MNFTIVLLVLAFVSVQSVSLNNNVAARTVAALICLGSPCFADADVMDTKNIDFNSWLSEMSEGNVESVIFEGINPSSLTSKLKSGVSVLVRDGFPVEDSLSPSGSAQAIVLCQHTAGVTCTQDVSNVLRKTRKFAGTEAIPPTGNPMLKSSPYPTAM